MLCSILALLINAGPMVCDEVSCVSTQAADWAADPPDADDWAMARETVTMSEAWEYAQDGTLDWHDRQLWAEVWADLSGRVQCVEWALDLGCGQDL